MINTIQYRGKTIHVLDISGRGTDNTHEIADAMARLKKQLAEEPPKSALLITNVSGARFNNKISELFVDFASHNTPYVKASALVGVSGVQKVILATIRALTRRDFYLADSLSEAKEWLVNQ